MLVRNIDYYPCLSHTHKNTPAWLPKHELNQNDTKGHAKADEEKPIGLNPIQRTLEKWRKLGTEVITHMEEYNWFPKPNCQSWKYPQK